MRSIREIPSARKSTNVLKAAHRSVQSGVYGRQEVGNAGGEVTKGQALKSLLHHERRRKPSNECCLLVKAQFWGVCLLVFV